MKKIKNLEKDLLQYDAFFVDMFGVLWDGEKLIDGTKTTLEFLVNAGKTVFILSNATVSSEKAIASNEKKGLFKGKHYHELITSGEVCNQLLKSEKLGIPSNYKKVFCVGTTNPDLFSNTKYIETPNANEADFAYIGFVKISKEKYLIFSDEQKLNWVKTKKGFYKPKKDCSLKTDFGLEKIQKKLLLNANPDLTAFDKLDGEEKPQQVSVQGTIANFHLKNGGELLSVGKPYIATYDYAFSILIEKYNFDIKKNKVVMVGDRLDTDILGAKFAKLAGYSIEALLAFSGITENINECEEVGIIPELYTETFGILFSPVRLGFENT